MTMAHARNQPIWHSIADPITGKQTAEQVLNSRYAGGFPVDLRPATLTLNGTPQESGDFGIVRGESAYDKKEIVFGYCTKRFHPLNPLDVCRLFDANVNQPVETMAFLGNGRKMFATWELPKFEVVVGDEIALYGILAGGWDGKSGWELFLSSVRMWCWNSYVRTRQNAKDKGSYLWRGKAVNKNLLHDLGCWMAHVQGKALSDVELMKSFFGKLAHTPVKNDAEIHEILYEAFPPMVDTSGLFPKELSEAKREKVEVYNTSQEETRDGIYRLFAGAGTKMTPDYWGIFNAVTEYHCQVQPSKKGIGESVMFGNRQAQTEKVVKILTDRLI
jgi:hypothetical protein